MMMHRVWVMGITLLLCIAAASSTTAQEDLSDILKKMGRKNVDRDYASDLFNIIE